MKILLDCSVDKIKRYSEKYNHDFYQLRTPLTKYKITEDMPYGLDNGCFSDFRYETWQRLLREAREIKPLFCCLPDVVGSAVRTSDLFDYFKEETEGLPRALVLQDGIANVHINFKEIDAVFVGGSDKFKLSKECQEAVRAAKTLGKWVHLGRCNGARVKQWVGVADSLDGSGISRFDKTLERLLAEIKNVEQQEVMFA